MPVVRLNDAAFMNLKTLATWLKTETPSETINALIEKEMERQDLVPDNFSDEYHSSNGEITFTETPGLTHTKVIFSTVNKQKLDRPNWGNILLAVIRAVKDKGLSKEQMSVELQINAESHKLEDKGYTFYPELGLSVQGQSAPDAWKEAKRLAEKYHIPLEVKFKWRDKEGAQYPGKIGIMTAGQ
ncbi:MAG: T4SS efffector SepA family protein [Alcanivorax sp.]